MIRIKLSEILGNFGLVNCHFLPTPGYNAYPTIYTLLPKRIYNGLKEIISSQNYTRHVKISETENDILLEIGFDHKILINETIGSFRLGCSYYHLSKYNPNINVIVEFSSPNIAKPFNIGTFRSTIIGNFIVNMKKYLGYNVTSINYFGDWGSQFGVLSHGYDLYGDDSEFAENPTKHLMDIYIKSNENCKNESFLLETRRKFNLLEKYNDPNETMKWSKFKDVTVKEYLEIYQKLGIQFDEIQFESMFAKMAKEIITSLEKQNIIVEKEGAKILASSLDLKSPIILEKKDGSSLYLSRDLAAALYRKEKYLFDKMYYVVDNSQVLHFRNLKKVFKDMNVNWYNDLVHLNFGRISGMSTRKGTSFFLLDVLKEAQTKCLEATYHSKTTKSLQEEYDKLSMDLAISSIFVNDLKHKISSNYTFELGKMCNIKGETGISLQYSHARLCSLEKYCGVELELNANINYDAVAGVEWSKLFALLWSFESILNLTDNELQPCILIKYLFRLSHSVNECFRKFPVKGQNRDIAQTRLLVFHCTKNILAQGLKIIGLKPLQQI